MASGFIMNKHSLSQHFIVTVRSQSAAAKWTIVYSTGRMRSVPFLHLAELCIQMYAEKLQEIIGSVLTGEFRVMSKWEQDGAGIQANTPFWFAV